MIIEPVQDLDIGPSASHQWMKSDCHISFGCAISNRPYEDRGPLRGAGVISPARCRLRLIVAGAGALMPSCSRCQRIVCGPASRPFPASSLPRLGQTARCRHRDAPRPGRIDTERSGAETFQACVLERRTRSSRHSVHNPDARLPVRAAIGSMVDRHGREPAGERVDTVVRKRYSHPLFPLGDGAGDLSIAAPPWRAGLHSACVPAATDRGAPRHCESSPYSARSGPAGNGPSSRANRGDQVGQPAHTRDRCHLLEHPHRQPPSLKAGADSAANAHSAVGRSRRAPASNAATIIESIPSPSPSELPSQTHGTVWPSATTSPVPSS